MRVSHWLLVACVAAAWLTRKTRFVDLHVAAGYCALFLVAFRVFWGFAGTAHARFSDFAYTPRAAFAYLAASLRGSPPPFTGHNPAGSWSVYVLLAGVALTSLTGIVAIAGMFAMGPLPIPLEARATNAMREAHEWLAWALLAVIAVHVLGAIVSSWLHRENLVAAMFTGRKAIHAAGGAPVASRALVALVLFAAAFALVTTYLDRSGWMEAYASQRAAARAARVTPDVWRKECGDCHLAYLPGSLPLRSWERMLAEQDRHFGEDLSLKPATVAALLGYARAAPPAPWATARLAASARAQDSPQRISELRSWRRAHRHLDERAFKPPVSAGRHDCEACHVDAGSGIFHPRMIQRPARESIY